MKYLLIIVLCLSVLPLGGCLLMYALTATEYRTNCRVEDSEANRLKVMHVVRLIADRYGLQERKEERSPEWRVTPFYDAPGSYPSSPIYLWASAYEGEGKVTVSLRQNTFHNATKKYAEIQERLVSELKERFGEKVDVEMVSGKIY